VSHLLRLELPGGACRRGVGEGVVNSGTPVGIVPASPPGRKGKFFWSRHLKGDCVRLAMVLGQRIGCVVERKLAAPFDAHRLGL